MGDWEVIGAIREVIVIIWQPANSMPSLVLENDSGHQGVIGSIMRWANPIQSALLL